MDIISKNEKLSSLLEALKSAGLEQTLKGEGKMTVFAPNNEAFENLPTKVERMKTEELTKLLKRHVVNDNLKTIIDITKDITALTTAGDDIVKVRKKDSKVTIEFSSSNATVVGEETFASNGVVHIIDTVLTAEEEPKYTVTSKLTFKSEWDENTFEADIKDTLKKDITDTLKPVSPNIEINVGLELNENDKKVVLVTFSPKLNDDDAKRLFTQIEDEPFKTGLKDKLRIAFPSNELDSVSSYKKFSTVVDAVIENEELSTLFKAIDAAKLVDKLKESGPFTVFAPNNDAFKQIPKEKLDKLLKPDTAEDLEALTTLVKRHVVTKAIMEDAFENESEPLQTMGNEKIKVVKDGTEVTVKYTDNEAVVKDFDITAINGVAHIITKVLM